MLVASSTASTRRRGRRRGRIPPQRHPDRQRETYFAALQPLVDETFAAVDRELVPQLPEIVRAAGVCTDALRLDVLRFDDEWNELVTRILDRVAGRLLDSWPVPRVAKIATGVAYRTSEFQRTQLRHQLRTALGVDPFLREPWLAGATKVFTHENVRLIQSLPENALEDVRQLVVHQVRRGARAETIAKEIRAQHGAEIQAKTGLPEPKMRRRAALIARDQVGKFYSDLNRERQKELGIPGYTWRTMADNRVCETCAPNEGKHFTWEAPPPSGHPGDCHPDDRCMAEPELSGYFAGL